MSISDIKKFFIQTFITDDLEDITPCTYNYTPSSELSQKRPRIDKNEVNLTANSKSPSISTDYFQEKCDFNNKNLVKKSSEVEKKLSTKFIGNFHNDGITGDFDGTSYPHSRQMMTVIILTSKCNTKNDLQLAKNFKYTLLF